MRRVTLLIAFAFYALGASIADAQSFTMSSPELPTDSADVQVINGIEVLNPSDWPATFVFRGLGNRPCTATVVGPRAVLTAAHCVGNPSEGDLTISGKPHRLSCTRHESAEPPEYDIALCVSRTDITLRKKWDRYERLPNEFNVDLDSKTLQLLGFGCTSVNGTDFGVLYVGGATVTLAPLPTCPRIETRGGAIACSGDSGGSAYLQVNGTRIIVGVNSKSDGSFTQLAALTDPATIAFLRNAKQVDDRNVPRAVRICGFDDTLENCR